MSRDYYVIDDNGETLTYEVGPIELLLDNELDMIDARIAEIMYVDSLLSFR